MKKSKLFTILFFILISFIGYKFAMQAPSTSSELTEGSWYQITLPNFYMHPCKNPPCGNFGTKIYSTQFPTAPSGWHSERDCPKDVYRMTSTRWVSNKLSRVRGISFKGLIFNNQQEYGRRENEFAIFFHEKRCYDGGPEYGWVFPENSKTGYFYLCQNCNLATQKWCQWPGDCTTVGRCSNIKKALSNPAQYRYWNIKVKRNGDFLIEFLDPSTWKYNSCTILRPDWFPNLYARDGYITITGQKGAKKTVQPPAYIHIDEVKIWQ